jgi:hypothetical protein
MPNGDGPQSNERVPVRERGQLSPPGVLQPVYECALAVHVDGFVPHALVKVWANGTELLAADRPVVGFHDFPLGRPLVVGDVVTATQEAFGFVSLHSYYPVTVGHQPGSLTAPVVGTSLYECGRVVPVEGLTASTRVEVYQGPTNPPAVTAANLVGDGSVTGHSLPVITSQLVSGHYVVARQVSCPGTPHEVVSPPSTGAVRVQPAPIPVDKPSLDPVIPGNDIVTLHHLYVGAEVGARDFTTSTDIGDGLATDAQNWMPVSPRIEGTHEYRARQALCSPSSYSDPAQVKSSLDAPVLISDICPGDRTVRIANTTLNATVVVMRGVTVIGIGGAVLGELELSIGPSFTINENDVLYARQYIGPLLLSPESNHVPVTDCRNVVTQHNDKWRRGANLHETALTPASVAGPGFGRLYERHVNGDQQAQVLYVRNVAGTRLGTKNLFFAATSTNEVYAFDADDYSTDPGGGLVWKTEPLGPTRLLNDSEICRETLGSVGITSTPVIDVVTQTMYVVARHWDSVSPPTPAGSTDLRGDHWLHALRLRDGSPVVPPRKVEGTDPRTETRFDASVQRNRPGLLLLNAVVYLGFGTFNCDQGEYHGWIFGYAADDLHPVAIFCTTRTVDGGRFGAGVWQSGNGLVGTDDGFVYFATGNDIFNPRNNAEKASPPPAAELADALVRLRVIPSWPGLETAGYFQPSNARRLRDGDRDADWKPILGPGTWAHWGDTDLAAGGPVLLPGGRLVGGGKQGRYYVVDSATMQLTQDQTSPDPAKIGEGFQAFVNTYHLPPAADAFSESDYGAAEGFGPNIHGGPVYWPGPGYLYQMAEKDFLKAYRYDAATGVLDHAGGWALRATLRPPDGMPGGHSSLSANDDRDGIVWTSLPSADGQWVPVGGTLHAFDALTLVELWADLVPERFAKFNPPTIADGHVFRPVFAQYSYIDHEGPNGAPARVGPGKVIVYGLRHQRLGRPPQHLREWRRWRRGGDPAPRWTIAELHRLLGASGVLAEALGEETELGDERGGKRRDFRGTVSSRRQRVSSRELTDVGDASCDRPPRRFVEVYASLFWSEATGAYAVLGEIRDEYLRLGGPAGGLGYPVSSETDTHEHGGRVSRFERGDIVWYPDAGAEVRRHPETPRY